MGVQIEQPENWWSFHPLIGLTIREENPDLDKLLWGDSTIISKSNIPQIVTSLNLADDSLNRRLISTLETAPFNEIFDSFILIKRKANRTTSNVSETPLGAELSSRANRIEALLALFHLTMARTTEVCALADKITRISETFTLVNPETGSHIWSGTHKRLNWINPLPTSRGELNIHLNDERFKVLSQVLLEKNCSLDQTYKNTITQSALMLSSSLQAPNFSVQLLNSITSIEVILGTRSERYNSRRNRVKALLGNQAYTALSVEEVFNARHEFVHAGKEIKDKILSVKAVGIAFASLLYYSKASPNFKTKSAFLQYLDNLYKNYELLEKNSLTQTALEQMIKHDMYGWNYPFLWGKL